MLKISEYQDILAGQGYISVLGIKISICLFLIDGLLIDTGPESLNRESSKFFRDNRIEQAALTHVHEDHSGMASWLQQEKNIPVYLHEKAAEQARQKGIYGLYRHMFWGNRSVFDPLPMPETLATNKYHFEVIDSPGHVRHHNVFLEKDRGWLFTGDLYLGTRQLVALREEDMQETIETIERILELDFDTVFCAHSGIVEDAKAKFRRKLNFFLEMQEKVNAMRQQGLDDHQIDKKLFPKIQPITIISRGEWSSYNMIKTL